MGQGTGLGLSMIYGFVRQSGGQIQIRSTPGEGTTMCLWLPRHYGAVADAAVEGRANLIAEGSGETVLVVDDEPSVRMLVTEVLGELGTPRSKPIAGLRRWSCWRQPAGSICWSPMSGYRAA